MKTINFLLPLLLVSSDLSTTKATQEILKHKETSGPCDRVEGLSEKLRREFCMVEKVQKSCSKACAIYTVTTKSATTGSKQVRQMQSKSSQRKILINFYESTNGDNWSMSQNWLTSSDECSWYGVACSDQGDVIAIVLGSNALTGSIPNALGKLTNLSSLYLASNTLAGTIPKKLGQLTNLSSLYMDSNTLTGSIPKKLGKLTNLSYLDLASNALTGSIPNALRKLTNLSELYLDDNQLTGSIPKKLGQLTNLSYLYLQDNNTLTGTIPKTLGKLTNLSFLYLDSNTLTGSIPKKLGQLTNLAGLNLAYNALGGSVPGEVCALIQTGNLSFISIVGNNGVDCECCGK